MDAKTDNQKAWLFVLPALVLVALQRHHPADDGGELLGAGDLRQQPVLLRGREVVRARCCTRSASTPRLAASCSSPASSWRSRCRSGVAIALAMPRRGPWVSVCLVLMALPLLIPWNVVGAMWNIFALPDIGLLGRTLNGARHRLQLHPAAAGGLGHHDRHGRLALDVAGGAARLCRPQRHSRRLLPGRQDRRRLLLGGLPLHPAAEDEARADHRRPAALHGQLQHLHRAVGADRRRARQLHDAAVDRPREDRARPVRPRAGGGHVAHLLPDHPAVVVDLLHGDDTRRGGAR